MMILHVYGLLYLRNANPYLNCSQDKGIHSDFPKICWLSIECRLPGILDMSTSVGISVCRLLEASEEPSQMLLTIPGREIIGIEC